MSAAFQRILRAIITVVASPDDESLLPIANCRQSFCLNIFLCKRFWNPTLQNYRLSAWVYCLPLLTRPFTRRGKMNMHRYTNSEVDVSSCLLRCGFCLYHLNDTSSFFILYFVVSTDACNYDLVDSQTSEWCFGIQVPNMRLLAS